MRRQHTININKDEAFEKTSFVTPSLSSSETLSSGGGRSGYIGIKSHRKKRHIKPK